MSEVTLSEIERRLAVCEQAVKDLRFLTEDPSAAFIDPSIVPAHQAELLIAQVQQLFQAQLLFNGICTV